MSDLHEFHTRLAAEYSAAQKIAPNCPICDQAELRPYVHEDRHQLGLIISICRHCGMLLVAPRPDDQWLADFYAHGYWPVYIGNRYRDQDDLFRRDRCAERAGQIIDGISPHLPTHIDRYLDIGCGHGGMLTEFRRRHPDTELFGIEPSADAVRFCHDRHQLRVACGDWLSDAADEVCGRFGLITMTHVVEHVIDPVAFVRRGAERLTKQGRIYVEVPDLLSGQWSGRDFFHLAHLQYFTEHSLRNLFARAGLTVEAVFHGLADTWPWAVGAIGTVADTGSRFAADVPAAPAEYFTQLEQHLNARLESRQTPQRLFLRGSRSALAALDRWASRVRDFICRATGPDVGDTR